MYVKLPITANTPRAQFAKNGRQHFWKSSMCYSWPIDSSHLIQPPAMSSHSDINQKQTRALFFTNVLPSPISVPINTHIFCNKNNGTVSNTAT